ncbi:BglG family transcription antiterminator [Bacillus tuaregi]|uniref:BglG family transcription antiterminator n=1 Tax=Bacillus tuaregi TaxID=1816695 RepID=UPI0008F8B689|nr:BglG family transcription antiterminator [Bacillus tuaregi]
MLITAREKAILELLIKKSGRHTALSFASYLHVSVRTIQRDLKNIEKILESFDLQMEKTSDNGLSIVGSNQNIYRLIQKLTKVKPQDLSLEERRLLCFVKMIESKDPVKLASLSKDLGVSITTLGTDLDELAEWLQDYGIELDRKRGVGVGLTGEEGKIRKALVNFYLIYFNNELIESLILLANDQIEKDRILYYLKKSYLKVIDEVVYEKIKHLHTKLADSDYITFLIHICISLQRIEMGFCLSKSEIELENIQSSEEFRFIKEISNDFFHHFAIRLSDIEAAFLVMVLRGSKVHEAEYINYDSVLIGRSIKKIIQHVSEQMNSDLTADFSLFQGLLAHMEPSIFRLRKGLSSFNPLTDEIKKKYPLLYLAVSKSVAKEFNTIKFTDDELAYIVLHFGSALELRKEEVQIRALIVCPTGIGTSKMLASRIKKEVPEITVTDVASIKEIQTRDVSHYGIIISTVILPVLESLEYVFVNPLLYEKDIEAIYDYIGTHIPKITRQTNYHTEIKTSKLNKPKVKPLADFMQEVDEVQNSIREILRNLSVYRSKNNPDYKQFLKEMVTRCSEQKLVSDPAGVYHQLLARETKGGLGIPDTNLALFHCRHEGVEEIAYHIAHLETPFRLLGMDGKQMDIHNILLLLAPEKLNQLQLEIISIVSSIIVEDKKAIMIFSSANEKVIRAKLEDTFFDYLQNKFVKE